MKTQVESEFARLLNAVHEPRVSVYILLYQQNLLTLSELADKIQVSRRTLNTAIQWLVTNRFVRRVFVQQRMRRHAAFTLTGVHGTLAISFDRTQ